VCFCFSGSPTYAQKIWEEGYIVKSDGTLFRGEVMVTKGSGLPKSCSFKRFDIAFETVYQPEDLKAFGYLYGNRYETRKVNNKTVFLECLATGKLTLLTDGRKIYIETTDHGLVELKKDKMAIQDPDIEFDNYKAYLRLLFTDRPEVVISDKLALKKEEICRVVASYNSAVDKTTSRTFNTLSTAYLLDKNMNSGTLATSFGIIGGLSLTKFNVFSTSGTSLRYQFIPEMRSYDISPVAGFFFNQKVSRLTGDLSVQAELLFRHNKVYIYHEINDPEQTPPIVRSDVFFNFTGIKMPVYIKVPLMKGNIKVAFNAGISLSYALSSDYIRYYDTESSTGIIRTYTEVDYNINRIEKAAMAGFSIKYHLSPGSYIFIDTRSEYGKGIFTPRVDYLINENSLCFSIICGYSF